MLYDKRWDEKKVETKFMAADVLGITEAEHGALIQVLGMLERGEIEASDFNMRLPRNRCGTVGCICGWANIISDGVAFPEVTTGHITNDLFARLNSQTADLFWINKLKWLLEWGRTVTPANGAAALRNYLTTGDARWEEAMSATQGA